MVSSLLKYNEETNGLSVNLGRMLKYSHTLKTRRQRLQNTRCDDKTDSKYKSFIDLF